MYLYLLVIFLALPVARYYAERLRLKNIKRRVEILKTLGKDDSTRLLGFFHPYCNAGGGGERVLWTAISAIQQNPAHKDVVCVVYTGDVTASKEDIIKTVKSKFSIPLSPSSLHLVRLYTRHYVEDSTWPRFTMIGQSLGSVWMAWEGMCTLIPDVYIDTMGYAFTFPLVSFLGQIPVGAYIHYPTISSAMVGRVQGGLKGHAKLLYYRLFMFAYGVCLGASDPEFRMVNSSWTKNHIDSMVRHKDPMLDTLWSWARWALGAKGAKKESVDDGVRVVYPPCDTHEIAEFPLEGRKRVILSLAQFRPEKNHPAQLHAFAKLISSHPEYAANGAKEVHLVMIGGCRGPDDKARVAALQQLAQDLGIADRVTFIMNAPYPDMLNWLSKASIGLSTMVDEHFGINIVEFMGAGVIPVTHASGGPLHDIVVPYQGEPTGYHATDAETFASALHTILSLSPAEEVAMRGRARKWALERFSEEEFVKGWDASGWRKFLDDGWAVGKGLR